MSNSLIFAVKKKKTVWLDTHHQCKGETLQEFTWTESADGVPQFLWLRTDLPAVSVHLEFGRPVLAWAAPILEFRRPGESN